MAAKLIQAGPEGRRRIDRYELVAEIASGGMATVYLARLGGVGGFQRFVAIKCLHPHLAGEQEFVEMFLDEARLAAGIHHPNVVPILEVGASERGYYIVMEYVEGDTLARLLARASTTGRMVPPAIALRVGLDMLAGLHAAHELRDHMGQPIELVHRDVSPQNVLVGIDGIARITDFGVAHAASRLSATRVGQLKGKIAYMAPEQASADPVVDRRADVFSSGIVLWEALTGQRLFKAEHDAATLTRIISGPIRRIHDLNPAVSPEVNDVVLKALERDPSKRFATCAKFADALERAGTATGVIASGRELGAYVTQVFGDEISAQRDAVRSWLARSEPSTPQRSSIPPFGTSVSAGAMALPGTLPGGTGGELTTSVGGYRPRRSITGVVVAALLVVGAVVAAFMILRPRPMAPLPAAPAAQQIAQAPTPVRAPVVVQPPAQPAALPPPAASEAAPDSSSRPRPPRKEPGPGAKSAAAEPVKERATTAVKKKKPLDGVDLSNPYR